LPTKRDHVRKLFASAATAALLAVLPGAGLAQSTYQTITTINPPPAARLEPRRVRGLPPSPPDDAAEARNAGRGEPGLIGAFRTHVAPGSERPADQVVLGGTPGPDGGETALREGPRQPGSRGNQSPIGIPAPVDASGVLAAQPAASGIGDQRSERDRDAFVTPPAGYDSTAFSTEISPRLDRRPGQLARLDPYVPTGIRLGTFVVLPEVEIGGAGYSNVFNAPDGQADAAIELRPSVRVVSDWRRHAAEMTATGGASFFNDFDSEDERSYRLESRGRLDVSRRTNVESLFSYDVTQETRGSADATVGTADRADIATTTSALALNHRLNRLSVQLRGMAEDVDAGSASAAGGGTISNDDQDLRTLSGAGRLTWEFKPTLFVFGEIEVARREFEQAAASDGVRRDANGSRFRDGLSFGNTSQILRGEFSLGFGQEDLDDPRLRDVDGILVDANLAWRPTRLTSLLFTARSDIDTTRVAGSGGARDKQVGLEVRHAARRNLIGSAGLNYNRRDYDGVSLLELTWTATAGVEYFASRNMSLFARYQHTWFDSSALSADYEADVVRVGMRWRR
jgi:hypothetical protein